MLAIIENGVLVALVESTNGVEMTGRSTAVPPVNFDPVRPSHRFVSGAWVENNDPPPVPPPPSGACIDFHSDAGTALTLTNSPAAARFLGGSNRHVRKVDLTAFRQVRFTARVLVAGAANARLEARWHGGSSLNIADYLPLGVTDVVAQINSVGWGGGQWIDLHPDAIGDNRLIAIRESGGDGVLDPQIGNIDLWLR